MGAVRGARGRDGAEHVLVVLPQSTGFVLPADDVISSFIGLDNAQGVNPGVADVELSGEDDRIPEGPRKRRQLYALFHLFEVCLRCAYVVFW